MSNAIETEFSKTQMLTRSKARRLANRNWHKGRSEERTGVNSAIAESQALLNDNDLKLHVYKKTLQAYLYPISSTEPHQFEIWNAKKPAYCYECEGLLWGLARQGKRCRNCGVKCHERCEDLINADCLQKAAAKCSHDGATDKTQNFISIIGEKMRRREAEKEKAFLMIRDVFNIPPDRHEKHMRAGKQSVLDGTCKWSAKLTITIIEAKDLQAKDKTGTSDPYVTVEVGKTKRRSKTIYNTLNPVWNETYLFECNDSSDRLKIQVWDEDDDLKSVVKQKLLRESDDFLGHALILVHTLSGDMDCWYNLEKRTEKSVVSGNIHVKISVKTVGEEKNAPYRKQYTCLHENIFHHLRSINDGNVEIPDQRGVKDGWKLYFKPDAQDVITEFAMRYGIEPMYQAMTHFSCLASAYQSVGTREVMANLLRNITKNYSAMQQQGSYRNKFEATNFGKEKFMKLLENLLNSLRIDISMYRKNFPYTDVIQLKELQHCMSVIQQIGEFRTQVLNAQHDTKSIISSCCKQCMESTYTYIFGNCNELYLEFLESTSETTPENSTEDTADSIEYWSKFLTTISHIFEEDKGKYAPIFSTFDVDLCAITSHTFWTMFCEDLDRLLSNLSDNHSSYTSKDFMNLQFQVKGMYNEYVIKLCTQHECEAHFFKYFQPFTLKWLDDNKKDSESIVKAAFDSDKKRGFQKTAEHSLFSSSVVDVFAQINQTQKILDKLDCQVPSVQIEYLNKLSENVDAVLRSYAQLVESAFDDAKEDVEIACVLMNNLHETRVLLEKLYQSMGGDEVQSNSDEILNRTQNYLNTLLDDLAAKYVGTFKKSLHDSCIKLSSELRSIRGMGPSVAPTASTEPTRESNAILKPLMDVLLNCLRVFSKSSGKSTLKRVLKELWKCTITTLEIVVVLPASSDETDNGRLDKILNPKQCTVLETALNQIKDFFYASGNGLKPAYMDKSPTLKKLLYALSLYTKTTDALIKLFVQEQTKQDAVEEIDNTGEVSIQVDLFTHPGTEEHKVTVKVVMADLKWKESSRFRPFIEVNLIGPFLANKRRRRDTSSKSGSLKPQFDESFTFELGNEAELDLYEIQFIAKDYCFMREDKIIGVGILQIKELTMQGSCACWCPLVRSLIFDQTGKTILKILSQRLGDTIAKEFVLLKSAVRSPEPE